VTANERIDGLDSKRTDARVRILKEKSRGEKLGKEGEGAEIH
jgi:hypothetical protein